MTRKPLLILPLVVAAALAGCGNQGETIVAGPGADEPTNTAANAGVVLPPAIAATKTYRCADNSVVDVDWLADQKSANVRTEQNGTPTQVTAPEPNQPMTGPGGLAVTGTADAPSISVTLPGQSAKSCRHG